MNLHDYTEAALSFIEAWEGEWGSYPAHSSRNVDTSRLEAAWTEYTERLRGNYPFFHPRYAGQMLKPPHPVAIAGYLAAMQINPNNHALDGGPPTAAMEKEVVRQMADMFHLPEETLGHLTGGGTVANLEALWVARHLHPEKSVAVSEEAHYTHERAADLLKLELVKIPADRTGRMDPDALELELKKGSVGTVVLTAGTTGRGTVDPIDDVLRLRERYGFRIHVDAAYGGFFALLAWDDSPRVPASDLRGIARCDSVVVDPHKHGLQPYGCGCVLFRDPEVGTFYQHESPYTYFTSDELHLGEISLECSRPGAAAGALWLTLRVLPLEPDDGLGPILAAGLRAADRWARQIQRTETIQLHVKPALDILTFYPRPGHYTVENVNRVSQCVFEAAMNDSTDPVYVSILRAKADELCRLDPELEQDAPRARILRSVLMKPTHENYVDRLHDRLVEIVERVISCGRI